jgi:hypothetical protein
MRGQDKLENRDESHIELKHQKLETRKQSRKILLKLQISAKHHPEN